MPADQLPALLRGAVTPATAPAVRDSFAILLGLAEDGPTLVDLVSAVRRLPAFELASLEAQLALAERATPVRPARHGVELALEGRSGWLRRADVDETASR